MLQFPFYFLSPKFVQIVPDSVFGLFQNRFWYFGLEMKVTILWVELAASIYPAFAREVVDDTIAISTLDWPPCTVRMASFPLSYDRTNDL